VSLTRLRAVATVIVPLALAAMPPAMIIGKSLLPVPSTPMVPFVTSSECGRPSVDKASSGRRGAVAFAQLPGRVLDTDGRLEIYGAPIYKTRGTFELVTVHLDRVDSWLGLDLARSDCRVDLFNRRQILGDPAPKPRSSSPSPAPTLSAADEGRQLMSASKDLAIYVALHALDLPVVVHDGGVVIESFCLAGPEAACARVAPAAKLLRVGDIVTEIDGVTVGLAPDIAPIIAKRHSGDLVEVRGLRGTKEIVTLVPLTSDNDGNAILGITPGSLLPVTTRFDYPFEVSIDSGSVGGPSAGLAFTLALIDALSPGELTGGQRVAATGEMTAAGRVAPIGGIRQKTIAVRDAGTAVFLVPKSQESDAKQAAAGSSLAVYGVADLDDALTVLADLGGDRLPRGPEQPSS
jgi:Lon-like protease